MSVSTNQAGPAPWPWPAPVSHHLPDRPSPVDDVAGALCDLVAHPEWSLPPPGAGRTYDRFVALAEISALDLSLGRLFEGHVDAIAILAEARRTPPAGAVMGVWAARRGDAEVTATEEGQRWRLRGRKPWASGAGTLTHALVTARSGEGDCLFEVPLTGSATTVVPGTWSAVGMAMSDSADVDFDVTVDDSAVVGTPGWYVHRPGFWFGSIGVAACWLGGAVGLVRALQSDLAQRDPDPHQLAHLGAAAARCASMARDLAWSAGVIDGDPTDPGRHVHRLALEMRHLVEDGCLEVLAHVGRAGGPGPLCQDRSQARRAADLPVYIRQHHAERDDETLGQLILTKGLRP